MRSAFDAVVQEAEAHRTGAVDERVEGLDDDLRRAASSRRTPQIRPDAEIPALVTPAEAAAALRVSIGSVYRAIRNGEIRATRLVEKRGALRIPRRELERLLEGRAATRTRSGSSAGHSSMR
jgi:excisionase family DNA binding protein